MSDVCQTCQTYVIIAIALVMDGLQLTPSEGKAGDLAAAMATG